MDKVEIGPYVIIISGIKLNFLSTETNNYGEHNMFQVLDGKQLGYIFRLAEESLKMPVWKYKE